LTTGPQSIAQKLWTMILLLPALSQGTLSASTYFSDFNAGQPLGISVHDHIIIGKFDHASMRGMKLI